MENAVLWFGMAVSFVICFFVVRRLGQFLDEVNGAADGQRPAKKRAQVVVVQEKPWAGAEDKKRFRHRPGRGARWPAA